ncbi:MAG: VWA domain-containing protein [Armatimonadota bacterium]|nr:MAG: VWA domain-containing protein [Armatimonadota bacterium]
MGAAFTHPWYLLLLPVAAALFWWVARDSLAGLTRRRRRVSLGLRIVAVALLVAALAGLQAVYRTRATGVVFVLDVSRSLPAEATDRALDYVARAVKQMRPNDRAAVVVFGAEPSLECSATARPSIPTIHSRPPADQTDIAAALRLAFAVLPERCSKRVVLLSDGVETRGDALDQALSAQAMGIEISSVVVSRTLEQEVMLEEASAPGQVRTGEPFELRAVASATAEADAVLRAYRDGVPVESKAVRLAPGKNVFTLTEGVDAPGFHRYEVLLEAAQDSYAENNRALTYTTVRGEPRLLYVEGDSKMAAPLRKALEEHDIAVDVVGLGGTPKTAADMAAYDAVLFSEVPATALHPDQMKLIKSAVSDLGVGFGMLGGEYGFGAGGYFKTPIEETLPVNMSIRKYKVMPAAAMVLVMDTSGSTGEMEGSVSKIRLEAEAAIATVESLQDSDQIAFVVSGVGVPLLAPMRRAGKRDDIISDISRMKSGGGGIFCRPSLEMAYRLLLDTEARTKHVVMLADGSDCDEQEGCVALAAAMLRKGITTTTVAFGNGPHVPFLTSVAAVGGGGFYLAKAGYQLPRIFTRDVLLASRSLIVEEPFAPQARRHETIAGIDWKRVPPLLGYVATSPKSLASVPLETSQGDPLFAAWRFGLGRSVAFTSDAKARWAAHWLVWGGYGKFWPQALRWMMRTAGDTGLQPTVKIDRGEGTVSVDAVTPGGQFRDFLELKANVVAPDATAQTLDMRQTAPGHYEAKFRAEDIGQYVVTAVENGAPMGTTAAAVPFPAEYRRLEPDRHLLGELARRTGGTLDLKPDDAFRSGPPTRYPQDLWHWLLIAALALWPLDVALRRLVINWAQIAEAIGALRVRVRRQPEVAPVATGTLLEHARSVRRSRRRVEAGWQPGQPDFSPPETPPVATPQAPRGEEVEAPREGVREPEEVTEDYATTGRLLESKRRRRKQGRPPEN